MNSGRESTGPGRALSGDVLAPSRFLLAFALLTVGILTAGLVYYRSYERHFRRQTADQLTAVGTLKVDDLTRWRKERLGDAHILFANSAFSALARRFFDDPADTDARRDLLAWLGKTQANYEYDRVSLLDPRGVERLAAPDTREPADHFLLESFPEILRTRQVTFLDFHRSAPDQPVHLGVMIPILDDRDPRRVIAVLDFRVDPRPYLYPYISRWPTASRTAETLLLRLDGNDVLFLNALRFRKDAALSLRIPLSNDRTPAVMAALGRQGVVEGSDYRGEPVLAYVSAVPESPWFLVARMDLAEVYAPMKERRWQVIALLGTLILGTGAGLRALWGQLRLRSYRERLVAGEELRASEERFAKAFHSRSILMAVTAMDGTCTEINEFGSEFLGCSREELIGRDLLAAHLLPASEQRIAVREALNRTGSVQDAEVELRTRDGLVRHGLLSLETIEAAGQLSLLILLTDFTGRKHAEEEIRNLNARLEVRVAERTEELEASNRELDAFCYSVSHDLRAPLRSIDGFSQALLDDYEAQLDEEGLSHLRRVRAAAQRMGQLIDDLLKLSRVTRTDLRRSHVDITRLAGELLTSLAESEPERRVRTRVQEGIVVKADPALIRVVLENLLGNAWKFSRKVPEASIEVGAETNGPAIQCFVRDNGAGFDMTYANKLFGAFQRLHTQEEFPGTGVGLATVQRIVHRHGGSVRAEGAPGQGATFFFTLPTKEAGR